MLKHPDLAGSDALYRRLGALRAHVERELGAIMQDLLRNESKASTAPSDLEAEVLANVPDQGWAKVPMVLKGIRRSTQARYGAVRTLVERGELLRRHGRVARRSWFESEDFGSQKCPVEHAGHREADPGKGGKGER